MKKSILLLLPLVGLISCGGDTPSTTTISSPYSSTPSTQSVSSFSSSASSSEKESSLSSSPSSIDKGSSSSSSPSSSEQSSMGSVPSSSEQSSMGSPSSMNSTNNSQPSTSVPTEELRLILALDAEIKENDIYELNVFSTTRILVSFNDASHEENVTFTTKEGIFGSSSSNITINENQEIYAKAKSDIITLTATTETTGLTASVKIKVVAPMDKHFSALSTKVQNALELEKTKASSGTFNLKNSNKTLSSTFEVFSNQSLEAFETNGNNETSYVYSGMYQDHLYVVKKDKDGAYKDVKKRDTDSSFASCLYQVNLSAFSSFYGISATIQNILTNQSYLKNASCYNHAELVEETTTEKKVYTITSNYEESLFSKSYTEFRLVLEFNLDDSLSSFDFINKKYDSTGYDFTTHTLLDGATPTSKEEMSASLNYETRSSSSTHFSPEELFITDYEIKLNNQEGTTFPVDTILEASYASYLPETAYPDIDPLSFVSSSNTSVVSMNDNKQLVCLAEGTTTLTFVTSGGVQKTIDVTVTYPGIESVHFSDSIKDVTKLKVGESIASFSAYVKPTLPSQSCSISITSGEEYASLTTNEDGTYCLTGISAGLVTLTASTVYQETAYTQELQIQVYTPLTDAQIKEALNGSTYKYVSSGGWSTTTYTLSFLETTGSFASSSYTITFDYDIQEGKVILSNLSSTSTNYTLTSLTLSDTLDSIQAIINEKSAFGPFNYTYTLSKETN